MSKMSASSDSNSIIWLKTKIVFINDELGISYEQSSNCILYDTSDMYLTGPIPINIKPIVNCSIYIISLLTAHSIAYCMKLN